MRPPPGAHPVLRDARVERALERAHQRVERHASVDEDLPQHLPVAEVRRHQQRALARWPGAPGAPATPRGPPLPPAPSPAAAVWSASASSTTRAMVMYVPLRNGAPLRIRALRHGHGQVLQRDASPDAQRVSKPPHEAREALAALKLSWATGRIARLARKPVSGPGGSPMTRRRCAAVSGMGWTVGAGTVAGGDTAAHSTPKRTSRQGRRCTQCRSLARPDCDRPPPPCAFLPSLRCSSRAC